MNNILIIPDESIYCTVSWGGADKFVQKVFIYQQDDRLYIETPKSEKNFHINMEIIWANGKRIPPSLDEDFGYIEVRCNSLESLYVNGRGTGDIYSQVPICELQVKIKGATSIDAIQIKNVDVEISGSGDISIDELNGNLHGEISGSVSIDILNGEVDNIDVFISGSGSLFAGITAQIAILSLSLSGSDTTIVAQIFDEYIKQKTGSGLIKVLKRVPFTARPLKKYPVGFRI